MLCCQLPFFATTLIAFISFLLQCNVLIAAAPQPAPAQPIAIDNRHYINCNPENNANTSMNMREVNLNLTVATHLESTLNQVQSQITRVRTKVTTQARLAATVGISMAFKLANSAQEHWWKIAGFCGLTGYLWLIWRNWSAKSWITSPLLWSAWHALHSYNSHNPASRKKAQKSLLLEISQRYLKTEDPLDYLSPLVQFGITIEQEIEHLKRLYTWRKRLDMSLASKLLLITGPTLDEISTQLEHAEQARSLFRSYIAAQNLQTCLIDYADDLYESKQITRRLYWDTIPEHGDAP